ncbi:ABC transporter ATP-binding protein [Companilactobacillus nantensis]|uniref:ABC transport system ATP-binding protein n=1 Tax=Companilactobacillus nantensis DSM 16982 TaxID=1423774 RepID=A0A0R1WA21_9LACO|nr:ATP-binding cassette domain-containing protein [Companilactobacillus nantensis]KRM14746.1 ABC transport system ATP-binding protein [Companilactobacillus nantensis DSM 16982]GEO65075.1 ABC transporter ATP-binding protein [Companilactobacillus nantensis]
MKPLLEIKDAVKTIYNDDDNLNILNNINLTINPKDFLVVLGTNGAGKSTLLDAITGTNQLTSGQILLNGDDITSENLAKRSRHISRVYQDPKSGTAPRMTVAENLLLAKRRGLPRRLRLRDLKSHMAEFQELISNLPTLDNRLNTFTDKLSGGQRQTLSFLMAIIQRPELLLLDEHTAALDPQTSKDLMELTNRIILEKELTCMMITHDLSDAMKYGNRLIVLKKGEIILDLNQEEKSKLTEADLLQYF